jgi:hypothetical protein
LPRYSSTISGYPDDIEALQRVQKPVSEEIVIYPDIVMNE